MVDNYYIMIAGVGGQGSVLLSRIIGDAALMKGLNVRIGETFGAAQRGGAVHSHVRIGKEVYGPLLMEDDADALLALEPLEGLRRGLAYLKPEGVVIINTRKVYPIDVNVGAAEYPPVDEIIEALKKLGEIVIAADFTEVAEEAGTARAMNIAVLGAYAKVIELVDSPFDKETLLEAMKGRVPSRWLEANLKAFQLGYRIAESALKEK
ncbi:MAG: indolepyruvate ferredoxin oxidoreductase subunit beta [Thermoprotei archaeon]|nr:MAG: indolepyruvate ferredoxin oxidoreductase subunit beta [Thermoprotei archaeon]